jgi:hypothetical protein
MTLTFLCFETVTAALYTLAAQHEKYLEPLRREVIENLEDGELTYGTLQRLPKLESFLRESGRFNIAGLSESCHPDRMLPVSRMPRLTVSLRSGTAAKCSTGVQILRWHCHPAWCKGGRSESDLAS